MCVCHILYVSQDDDDTEGVAPVTHWIPALKIHCVAEDWMFDKLIMPIDLFWSNTLMLVLFTTITELSSCCYSVTDTTYTRYLPLLYINELSVLDISLLVSNTTDSYLLYCTCYDSM